MSKYKEYKDSGIWWLGEIPSHWDIRKSKYLWTEIDGRSEFGSEQLLSVSQYDGVREATEASRSESLKGYKIVDKDNLVINIMLAWLGGLGVSQYHGIVSPAYCVYKLIGNNNPRYLHYLYRTPLYLAEFARHSTGIVPSRWRMYTDDFGQVLTILPPIEEQEAMVEYLDRATAKIDRAIAQQERMIDLLNERKQIIIQKAVTKGLDPDTPMKDSGVEGLCDVPLHWDIVPFKTLFTYGRGLNITKEDLSETGIPVISYGQIHSKMNKFYCITEDLIRFVPDSYLKQENCLVHKGDFIFADTSEDYEGCGNSVYIDKEMALFAGYHTIVARPKDRSQDYTYYSFLLMSRGWRTSVRRLVNGVKVYTVSRDILSKTKLLVPPLDEQQKICRYLIHETTHIDKAITLAQQKIEILRERRQIVINEVVTGKVKVL